MDWIRPKFQNFSEITHKKRQHYPWTGSCPTSCPVFQKILQRRFLYEISIQVLESDVRIIQSDKKLPNTVKNGQRLPRSDQTLDSVEKTKRQQILSFSWKTSGRRLDLLDSILVVQNRTRALYLPQAPSAHNASVSSRYSGLWGRFWTYFHPKSPYETLENTHSRVVFDSKIFH